MLALALMLWSGGLGKVGEGQVGQVTGLGPGVGSHALHVRLGSLCCAESCALLLPVWIEASPQEFLVSDVGAQRVQLLLCSRASLPGVGPPCCPFAASAFCAPPHVWWLPGSR